jgi:hypothetical protein
MEQLPSTGAAVAGLHSPAAASKEVESSVRVPFIFAQLNHF